MSPARADRPSAGVLLAGGVGVVAVVAFVAALAVGTQARETPGELVRLVRAEGPAGVAVLAGRCLDQRVLGVAVADADGAVRWRISSRKGSIERRFVVGATPPPLGFEVTQPLEGDLPGVVRATVVFARDGERRTDERSASVASLRSESDELAAGAPACGDDARPGATVVLFGLAAALVVAGYGLMVWRRVRP